MVTRLIDENAMDVVNNSEEDQPDNLQVHSRIVYDEIGSPLRYLRSLSEYFAALAQVMQRTQS